MHVITGKDLSDLEFTLEEEKEGENKFQTLVIFGDTLLLTTLTKTLNKTTVEVNQTIKDFPEETNIICFAPNVRKIFENLQ